MTCKRNVEHTHTHIFHKSYFVQTRKKLQLHWFLGNLHKQARYFDSVLRQGSQMTHWQNWFFTHTQAIETFWKTRTCSNTSLHQTSYTASKLSGMYLLLEIGYCMDVVFWTHPIVRAWCVLTCLGTWRSTVRQRSARVTTMRLWSS